MATEGRMGHPSLPRLYDLLACPACRSPVRPQGKALGCVQCGRTYPIVRGIPVLLPEGSQAYSEDKALGVRTGYDPWIHRTVLESLPADRVVLEIGAGNMSSSLPNLIRMDVTLTPYVDVVGDADALPFRSASFDFIFSLAVMEHLRQPFVAAEEMFRVLRNGGYVYTECAFVFPFHGHPHHYFNASHLGLRELFRRFCVLRGGVAPYQMPSFAVRALLDTYLALLRKHEDAESSRLKERIGAVLSEDLAAFDSRFSDEDAQRCAACTYLFGVKAPEATEVIPAVLLDAHRRQRTLRQRFPNPLDISVPDNLLAWARSEEARRDPAIAAHFDRIVSFRKGTPTAAAAHWWPLAPGTVRARRWLARAAGGTRALGRQLRRVTLDRGNEATWTHEEVMDGGERITHLSQNDCYFAHLSIYGFARPLIQEATVLDAGSGAGYGAAYFADRGAKAVLGIDVSAKAVAFSRHHFPNPNLRYEVRDLTRLEELAPGAWNVVFSSNVLEHVWDVGSFLRGVRDLLAPHGVLVVAVPPIVNEALRSHNLDNPYHLNIWTPRQWAHVLRLYFDEVQAFQHWYEKPGVELKLTNSPAETVVNEDDFIFPAVTVEQLYEVPTITAIFMARSPVARDRLPVAGTSPGFIDDSFTRPPPARVPRFVRAWRAVRTRTAR